MMTQDDDQQAAVWVVLIGAMVLAIGLALGVGLSQAWQPAKQGETLFAAGQAATTTGTGDSPAAAVSAAAEQAGSATATATATATAARDADQDNAPAPAPAAEARAASAETGADAQDEDVARVLVEDELVKFYFATGKAELAEGAHDALAVIIKGVATGQTAVVSGFHDATGNLAFNQELALQRAEAVAEALRFLGVGDDKIALRKPEDTEASGSLAEARRVEVRLE